MSAYVNGVFSLTVVDVGSSGNNLSWRGGMDIIRLSATTVEVNLWGGLDSILDRTISVVVSVSDLATNALPIKYTGQDSNSNTDEITQRCMIVDLISANAGSGGGSAAGIPTSTNDGRLTLSSTASVTTADTTSDTLYFLPHKGNEISLYDGSAWGGHAFSSISASTSSLSTGKNYDVFAYDDSGVQLRLEAWETDSGRFAATDLARHDGVWVKVGDPTLRYLGTVRTVSSSGVRFRDSTSERFVWNACNRVKRSLIGPTETADSWTYSSSTYRQSNGNASNQVEIVVGLAEDEISIAVKGFATDNIGGQNGAAGIGVDSTSTNSAVVFGGRVGGGHLIGLEGNYRAVPTMGYHYYAWLESSYGAGTVTWYGDGGSPHYQAGIWGVIWS